MSCEISHSFVKMMIFQNCACGDDGHYGSTCRECECSPLGGGGLLLGTEFLLAV